MKQIILKKLKLVNFKGIRNLSVDFGDSITSVMGCNGSGKTTLFDSFTWLLFGKDSEDRKQFNIKTLDANGRVIEKLPHEVSALITIDGEQVTLTRRFTEKWTKKRGSAFEEFTGHEEERLYNEVPCSLKEWNEKIESICPEQVFKFITNPLYFTSQKTDAQRTMLFRMAGGVSDEEVAESNEDFKNLLGKLTGKTLDEYKKEIQAKKRRVKAEIDGIPERIDERKREQSSDIDFAKVESELNGVKADLAAIDKEMLDESQSMKELNEKKKSAMNELTEVRKKSNARRSEIERNVLNEYYKNVRTKESLERELESLSGEQQRITSTIKSEEDAIIDEETNVSELRSEWKKINAEQISFSEGDFICPTCKRPLDVDDIEKKQSEMTKEFNAKKSERLANISTQGKQHNAIIEECKRRIENAKERMSANESEQSRIKSEIEKISIGDKPDTTEHLQSDDELTTLIAREIELENFISKEYNEKKKSDLTERRRIAQDEYGRLTGLLSMKETKERNEKRILELEESMKTLSVELASLEGIEFTIQEFSKAKTEAVEARINKLFRIVRFKMFEKQINGGEVETCEAMVNGVPFSDLNNASKINAGLDIINAICESEGVTAPIIVDNAESVNTLLSTKSQMIRLVVTEDKELTII